MRSDTIFAPATAPGVGGVAIIRLSGPRSGEILREIADVDELRPRHAARACFRHPASGEVLDDGLALWFPGPASYTGEDVAEFHVHGGRATVSAVIACLGEFDGVRLARPGEFSRRAFLNGRLGLTEAEAIADLVAAETEAQRRQALRQLGGALGTLYEGWRERLIAASARIAAGIDFSDEDLPGDLSAEALISIFEIRREIAAHLADGHRGERLRDGYRVAILGAPNVGKSSLLNRIAERDVAIVSEHAGTTRDVLECHLDLKGWPVILCDTAGVRDSVDPVEIEGVARAVGTAGSADFSVIVVDAREPAIPGELGAVTGDAGRIVVANKADLLAPGSGERPGGVADMLVSARTGTGIGALLAEIARRIAAAGPGAEAPALTRARHRECLERCMEFLNRCEGGMEIALLADELRLAARELGRITGRVGVEDVLDVVFQEFCIGK